MPSSLHHSLLAWALLIAPPYVRAQRPPAPVTVFRDVNVVPMNQDTVLSHRTVVVRAGRIASIEPARGAAIPRGAFIIEGRGKAYLMPGLADMHVHMFERGEMLMYLANGITTVRNLHGIPRHLAWRDSIAAGLILGPRLFTSGPIVDGDPPDRSTNVVIRDSADAERVVAEQKAAGYDFLKIYDNVPYHLYRILAAASRRQALPMVGHVPTRVGLDGLLEIGEQKSIEHVEELLPSFPDRRDTAAVEIAARRLAEAGVWVVPTITVFESAFSQARDWSADQRRSEMRYMNPTTSQDWGWTATGRSRAGNPQALVGYERTRDFFIGVLMPALHHARVRVLAGSDAPIPTIVPGFSLVGELRSFVRAGYSPYEALVTATRNPAEFLNRSDEFGTVIPGRVADLILLSANPLKSVDNLGQRLGVMVRGAWLPEKDLRAFMEARAASIPQGHL